MPKFETPEEEVSFLREEIKRAERALEKDGNALEKDNIAREHIKEYQRKKPEEVLSRRYEFSPNVIEGIALDLAPEKHDEQINELFGILIDKGVKNALSVVARLNNPHLEDDFHRFLVSYLKVGHNPYGIDKNKELLQTLQMKLFEVTLPSDDVAEKSFSQLVSAMEQFYAGMLSISSDEERKKIARGGYFTIEITLAGYTDEVIFYVGVPSKKSDLFEKQLTASFPRARAIENKNDYNIFIDGGVEAAAIAKPREYSAMSLKTFEVFEHDPLRGILNAFSKLKKEGEGAAIQIVIRPVGEYHSKRFQFGLKRVREGVSIKHALDLPEDFFGGFRKALKEFALGDEKKKLKEGDAPKINQIDETVVKHIEEKLSSPIVDANLRIVASAGTKERADAIVSELESAFHQFGEPTGNSISFIHPQKSDLKEMLYRFTFRMFEKSRNFPFSLKELTTMIHFPVGDTMAPQLKQARAGTASAPLNLPDEGVLLGINRYRHQETAVRFAREDRMRHFYTVGQTGTGKTTLLKNMIEQDIKNGDGVCMIDPHGTDIKDILGIIPNERLDDVIYFDPSDTARPMGLNMLEYDPRFPEQKTFVVNELFSIFQKLYGAVPESMGPMFEQYFRNATMLVIDDPETGGTLLDVSRVLADQKFRELKLSRAKNPIVIQFWKEIAEKASGESGLANIVPYITSKFDVFLANDIMRPIIAQEHSAFNFREVMDERKILLVNLSKGRLGDINSHLIGLIIVGKILMAALSRVDMIDKNPPDFYLYIDEFQNVTTDSIATILSEARKYRLSLNIAHQYIGQLEEKIRNSVFGNVGSMAVFRVGAEDAKFLESQFEPVFSAADIIKLENRNAYLKLLVNGEPVKPFNIETTAFEKGTIDKINHVKELSAVRFGRARDEVEKEIMGKYKK